MVLVQVGDGVFGEPVFGRVGLEFAAAIESESVRGANPQRTIAGRGESRYGVRREVAIGFVEDDEVVTIETGEAFIRAEPQIAVRSLGDGSNRILRQTLLLSPDQARI